MSLRTWTRHIGFVFLAVIVGCLTVPVSAYQLPFKGYPKIEVSGNNTMSLNLYDVTGSENYYLDDNYDKRQTLSHSSNLYLTGELLRDLHLNVNVVANQFMPGNTSWNLHYDGSGVDVLLGEFSASLPGNEFVLFNRFLLGVKVEPTLPKGTLTLLTSRLKSPVQTDTFYGRNVSGPYYLSATPIIDGSEVVTINDERKARLTDYTLDYVNGILNFVPTIIVSPTDRVTVSYEVMVNGAGSGMLSAARAAYPVAPNVKLGVSHLRLDGQNSGPTVSTRKDQYLGTGTPGPFTLTYRPIIVNMEVVTINGIQQVRDVDYTIDYTRGTILFNQGHEPPSGSTVTVQYQVTVPALEGGNRSVTGIDMDWQVRRGLKMNLQAAQSIGGSVITIPAEQIFNESHVVNPSVPLTSQTFQLAKTPIQSGSVTAQLSTQVLAPTDFTVNYQTGALQITNGTIVIPPTGGVILLVSYTTEGRTVMLRGDSALTMSSNYTLGRLTANVRYRQVDPGFTPLEMVGYRTTRQGFDWTALYKFTPWLSLNVTGNNTRLPYNPYTQTGADEILMDERNRSYALSFNRKNWPLLTLRHSSRDSRQVGSNSLYNANTTDSANLSWNRGVITTSLDLFRTETDSRQLLASQDPYTPLPEDPDPDTPVYALRGITSNGSLRIGYNPNQRLNLGVTLAANQVESTDNAGERTTTGRNIQANALYRFSERFSMTANMTSSNTGATTTAGGGEVPALQSRNLNLGADWMLSEKLSLSAAATADYYQGGEYSNSESQTLSLNAAWQPMKVLSVNGYWFGQDLQYLGSTDTARTFMIGATTTVTGLGKLGIKLDAQRIWGNNNIGVQNLFTTAGSAKRVTQLFSNDVRAATPITGTDSTTISAKVTYQIAKRQELYLAGENTQNTGYPSASAKDSYGLGWNYLLNNNLTLTLDTRRLVFVDEENSNLNYSANQMNAQISWQF
ncbi:MAG: hypothetical protein ACYC7E_13755 [Armatimonadota bacterium]